MAVNSLLIGRAVFVLEPIFTFFIVVADCHWVQHSCSLITALYCAVNEKVFSPWCPLMGDVRLPEVPVSGGSTVL